jgi:serine/threonine protein kinase
MLHASKPLFMIEDLSYENACSGAERTLIKGKALKADVFVTNSGGTRFIVKDFSGKGFLERNLVGRIVVGRESRAYCSLAGIEGLPSRYKRLNAFSIAIEYLDGKDLGGINRGEIGPGVIRQFEQVVEELHERGWVHLDLQRRSNILLVDGKVFVVDLASALHPGSIPLIGRMLTRLFGFADRMSLIKMKSIYAPELMSQAERKLLRIRNLTMPRKW